MYIHVKNKIALQILKIIIRVLFLGVCYAIVSCSTKKDTIISRNYHALTSEYNILFNGNTAFQDGIKAIDETYKEDWFSQIPIEPITFDEDKIVVPSFNNKPGAGFSSSSDKKETTTFERAEEKAVKAIQTHGMNIEGMERNRQIDDAYLLLGKSRYYQQRFIPAVEAFNYVIANYPNANLIAETKIWRAKTNIRLDNEETAIESMKLLLVVKDTLEAELPNKIKEQGHTALAMAYLKSDSLQNAKKHLLLATRTLENKAQAARNLFVLGQLYSSENKKDSASWVFKKLANFKKAPYKYKIHAQIALAKNTTNDSTSVVVLNTLQELIKDRANKPYLDQLYYQSGVLQEKKDSIQLAKKLYYKSLRAENGGEKQKTFTYENLGNLAFKESLYQNASAYYDSVLQFSKDILSLRIRRIKRKYKNLASLIQFENTLATNDSILKIVALSKEAQTAFFQNYIEKLKKEDEAAAQRRLNQMAFGGAATGLASAKKGEWYFYNSQSLGFGKSEFLKIWGSRVLEDNWRWSEKASNIQSIKDTAVAAKINVKYDLETYLNTIPTEKKVIDSLAIARNEALYELGLIYKEQFKNYPLAAQRLLRAKDENKDESFILPIHWHLYQLYTTLGKTSKALIYKNKILTEYPETKFAKIILNPNIVFEDDVKVSDVESKYKMLYYAYKDNNFSEVIHQIDAFLPTIPNAVLLPKFELLKALAVGKSTDKKTYEDALTFVVVNYASTPEAEKAKDILAQLKK